MIYEPSVRVGLFLFLAFSLFRFPIGTFSSRFRLAVELFRRFRLASIFLI